MKANPWDVFLSRGSFIIMSRFYKVLRKATNVNILRVASAKKIDEGDGDSSAGTKKGSFGSIDFGSMLKSLSPKSDQKFRFDFEVASREKTFTFKCYADTEVGSTQRRALASVRGGWFIGVPLESFARVFLFFFLSISICTPHVTSGGTHGLGETVELQWGYESACRQTKEYATASD